MDGPFGMKRGVTWRGRVLGGGGAGVRRDARNTLAATGICPYADSPPGSPRSLMMTERAVVPRCINATAAPMATLHMRHRVGEDREFPGARVVIAVAADIGPLELQPAGTALAMLAPCTVPPRATTSRMGS
jgi:hypothetical protein